MGSPINESVPRVPDPHTEIAVEDEKLYSDLYIRTSWFDAALALDQIEKVRLRLRTVSLRHNKQKSWMHLSSRLKHGSGWLGC